MRLTALEFEGGVTLHDALTVLQRAEMVTRMAVEIERYIVELGAEGRLIEMQLEEMLVGVAADRSALVRDYLVDNSEPSFVAVHGGAPAAAQPGPARLRPAQRADGLRPQAQHARFPVTPRGYRIWARIPRLPESIVDNVVREFGGFDLLLGATSGELESVEGVAEVRAKEIREGLRRLQEINLVDRYLQT